MSTVSVAGEPSYRPPSMRWLSYRTCLEKASGWLGVHFSAGTTWATVQERTRARPRRGLENPIPGKLHIRNIPPVLSRPSGTRKKIIIALGLKAASKSTLATHNVTYTMLHQRTPKVLFCNPVEWVWKYCMSHHIEGRHATSLALSKTDPKTVRFEDSFDVSKAERAAAKKLRKGKGKADRAPVARRSKVSQQTGGSDESDESHSDESHSDESHSDGRPSLSYSCRRSIEKQEARSKRLRSKIIGFGVEEVLGGSCLQASYFLRRRQPIIDQCSYVPPPMYYLNLSIVTYNVYV